MTLPPGRARLATKPAPTGSPALAITMGMEVVARLAANTAVVPETTIGSTFKRTKSAASSGWRSDFCSANRNSMVRFFPSIHPSLLNSCRNASTRTALPAAVLASRNPMRKIFPDLLRAGPCPAHREHDDDCEKPHPFSILNFRLFGHRITLSALTKTSEGIANPICLAVFKLPSA